MSLGSDDDVRILADMEFTGSLHIAQVASLPPDPKVVTLVVKGNTLYGYLNVQGVNVWCPFAKIPTNYVHKQDVPAYEWVLNHNLNSTDVWVQAKDATSNSIPFRQETISPNATRLRFLQEIKGSAIVMTDDIPPL